MKKYLISAFLVVVLSLSLVATAFAADVTPIGAGLYYTNQAGFGGGSRASMTVTLTSTQMTSYYNTLRNSYNQYSYSYQDVGDARYIQVKTGSTYLGRVCNSSGAVYVYYTSSGSTISSGGSTDVSLLQSINSKLWATYDNAQLDIASLTRNILNRIDSITAMLWSTYNGTPTDIAVLVRYSLQRLDILVDRSYGTYANDGQQHGIGWIQMRTLERLDTIISYLWSTYNGTQTEIGVLNRRILENTDILVANSTNRDFDLNVDGLESKLGTANTNLTTIKNRLLKTGSDGTVYTAADLLYNLYVRLGITNGYIDTLESKAEATNTQLSTLDNSISSGLSGVESKLDTANSRLSTANTYLSNIKDSISDGFITLNGYVDGVESKLDTTNSRLNTVNTRLNTVNTSVNNGFSDVSGKLIDIENALSNSDGGNDTDIVAPITNIDNNVNLKLGSLIDLVRDIDVAPYDDSMLLSKLSDIENALSNHDDTPIVSSNSPYARKIYHVLYGGVDGTGTDMVDIATSQMGVSEGRPYYTWYGFNSHVEWCAVFVSWCADQCGYLDDIIPKFAVVDDGVSWYKSRSLWLDGGGTPSPGDIIFFDWDVDHDPDHVGIVADCVDGIVTTVEGNTGDSPGVVSSRTIAVNSPLIYGYGTPDYPVGGASIYTVLVGISGKLDNLSRAADSYDDTVLIAKLTDIENTLSKLGGDVVVSIDNVTNVDIPLDNDAHDVFYVTDDDGDKSIVDLSGNSVKIVGKLMNFLYQVMFKDALNDSESGIQGLYDFYLDNSEGVDVWAS